MILHCQQTPAMPSALLVAPAAMPATCEPWTNQSEFSVPLSGEHAPPMQLTPGTHFGARSGCVQSMPVSEMAMIVAESPVDVSQAAGAWIFWGPYCPVTFGQPARLGFGKHGSLGTSAGSAPAMQYLPTGQFWAEIH